MPHGIENRGRPWEQSVRKRIEAEDLARYHGLQVSWGGCKSVKLLVSTIMLSVPCTTFCGTDQDNCIACRQINAVSTKLHVPIALMDLITL